LAARLLIQAKIGELAPHGGKGGRGKTKPLGHTKQFATDTLAKFRKVTAEKGGRGKKKTSDTIGGFKKDALTKFRKVTANVDSVEDYEASCNESDPLADMSTSGFVNWVGSGGILAAKHNNGEAARMVERVVGGRLNRLTM